MNSNEMRTRANAIYDEAERIRATLPEIEVEGNLLPAEAIEEIAALCGRWKAIKGCADHLVRRADKLMQDADAAEYTEIMSE